MKNLLFSFLFCLSLSFSNANELIKLELADNQKLESTYSVSLSNNTTFHLAIIINSKLKKHEIYPFYITSEKQVKQLDKLEVEKSPNIISYHMINDEITFITYNDKDKELSIIDFNTVTGKQKVKTYQDKQLADNIFRLDNKTMLVYSDKKQLEILEIINTGSKVEKNISLSKEDQKIFRQFLKQKPQEVNQNEYVKNGSINNAKVYLSEDKNIVYTIESNNNSIDMMTFNTALKSVTNSTVNFDDQNTKYKDFNTYLQNDNLFAIMNNNDDIVLKNYNITDKTHKKTLSIRDNLTQIKTKNDHFEEYLKEARKSKMKPTITLNENKDSNFVVRLDYVNKNTYNYHYNWWLLHWMEQQHMMMNMHMMNHNMSMGPNPAYYDDSNLIYGKPIKEESKSIEFVLDINTNKIVENAQLETLYSNVDKKEQLDQFEDNSNIKEITAGFTETEIRYIYQDKKSKVLYIHYNKL